MAPLLLVVRNDFVFFLVLYLFITATDIFDGYLARRYNCCSLLGSRLDSLADGVLFITLIILVFPIILSHTPSLVCILFISILRIGNILVTRYKHHAYMVMHTYANKVTGFALVIGIPFILFHPEQVLLRYVLFLLATVSAVEECFLLVKNDEYNPNEKGLFFSFVKFK